MCNDKTSLSPRDASLRFKYLLGVKTGYHIKKVKGLWSANESKGKH